MRPDWLLVGAVGVAVSVALGAFAAHGLKARLDAEALALWETGARYLIYSSLGLCLIGLFERLSPGASGASGLLLLAGATIFSGTLAVMSLGGPRWLGAITPIGGALMIFAWLRLAWAAFASR